MYKKILYSKTQRLLSRYPLWLIFQFQGVDKERLSLLQKQIQSYNSFLSVKWIRTHNKFVQSQQKAYMGRFFKGPSCVLLIDPKKVFAHNPTSWERNLAIQLLILWILHSLKSLNDKGLDLVFIAANAPRYRSHKNKISQDTRPIVLTQQELQKSSDYIQLPKHLEDLIHHSAQNYLKHHPLLDLVHQIQSLHSGIHTSVKQTQTKLVSSVSEGMTHLVDILQARKSN